jgi:hypothetical protein
MEKNDKLAKILEESKKFTSLVEVEKSLRSLQSKKCRFLKQKERKDYSTKLTKILQDIQILVEVKKLYTPEKTKVTKFCQKDIELLNFAETVKAIKSIQSKKCNCQYMTDKTDFVNACEIERMLLEHKKSVLPINANSVEKSKIQDLVKLVEDTNDVDKNLIIQKLSELLK